jgi:Fe-S cluster assembly iron-binding protein IscA
MEITDRARKLLAGVVERAQGSDVAALRIVSQPEGWGMEMGEPRPEDETFEHDARTVLVLDSSVAESLKDLTLDVHDTPEGPRLRLR